MSTLFSRRSFMALGAGAAASMLRPGGLSAGSRDDLRLPRPVRVGIIGLSGHYGEATKAAERVPDIHIAAITEARPDLLARASRNEALARAATYDDHRVMLDEEQLDVVVIAGENGPRAATIQDCAARGLPVAAEKPLALSLEELDAVKKAVSKAGIPLTILLPMRFYPEYRAMRRIVQEGQIGEVVSMSAQKSYRLGTRPDWMKARQTFGGTIPYIGIHMVDLMRWTSQRFFTEVAAFHANVGFPDIREMENNAAAIFRMDNQGTASLRLDYLRPEAAPTHGDDRLRLAGTRGVIEYRQGGPLTLITDREGPTQISDLPAEKLLLVDFIESLYSDTPHVIRPSEAFRVTEVVLKAREAADGGRIVQL